MHCMISLPHLPIHAMHDLSPHIYRCSFLGFTCPIHMTARVGMCSGATCYCFRCALIVTHIECTWMIATHKYYQTGRSIGSIGRCIESISPWGGERHRQQWVCVCDHPYFGMAPFSAMTGGRDSGFGQRQVEARFKDVE